MKPLTNKQKAILAQMAKQAYDAVRATGCPVENFAIWRKEQQLDLVGIESMRDMDQTHYVPLKRLYTAIIGGTEVEDNTWSDRDKVIYELRKLMALHEITAGYLWTILQNQFAAKMHGYEFQDMWDVLKTKFTATEIKHLLYTIDSRGKSKTALLNTMHNLDSIK